MSTFKTIIFLRNRTVALIFATEQLQQFMRRDVFQAIADPTRRAILSLIALNAMTPNAIAEHFDVSRQAISRHIRILEECKLVSAEQDGREINYHFNANQMKEVDQWMDQFRSLWEIRFSQLDTILKQQKKKTHVKK